MTRKFSRNSYRSVVVPCIEPAAPPQPSPEEVKAAREADLRTAAREYEAELLAIFERLPKWHTTDRGQIRHYYWNGHKWIEYDLENPPLWVVESIDVDNLAPPPR